MVGLYLSLLFIFLVINLFLSYFKRAPLKIDAIIFHLYMTLVLKHHYLSQFAFFSGCNWKLKLNLCFPRSFMQLKSDAGNLILMLPPLVVPSVIMPVSLGLVALLKMLEDFRMLIIPWEWGFASGWFGLLGCTAVVTRMVVLSSLESQSALRQSHSCKLKSPSWSHWG